MAAYDDWWASPEDWLYPRRPPGMLPPQDQLWRAGGPTPTMPNWGQLQDPGVFTAPRRPPAGDVVLPSGQASFGDTTPPPQDDSTFRLATAALAPYATGNARLGGASSVEGVGEDLSNRFLKMAAGMPEPLRARLAIESGYRDRARQMQVNPSALNSRHGAGTGPPGTGAALDLAKDPEVLQWIRENGPQYGVGFPLYPKDPREINHLEAVSGGGARLPAGASPPSQGQGQGQQRMAGISDIFSLFGGGQAPTPGLLDQVGYMDPKEYDARRNSASMMGLYAGLLQGGGPSLTPRNFGSALGAGLMGQNQFGTQFDEAQQHRATAQAKLAEIDFKKQGAALTAEWIRQGEGGGVKTPADTAGTPAAKAPDFGEAYKGEGDPASLTKHFESGGNYNIGYGGTDLSKAPRDEFGFPIWEGKDNSHAAGAYQFQPGTWARYAGPLGIKDFSPDSQDKVFAAAFAAEGWKPWVPYNPRLAAEVARRTGQGAGERTAAAGAPVPDFTEGRSAQLGNAVAPDILNRERVLAARAPAPGPLAAPAVLAGPEAAPAPAPRVLTQQAQYAADVAAGRRPILPPGTKFNSRGEAISPDLTATLPGQQSGANYPPGMRFPADGPPATSGSTIRPIAATDEPPADAGGDGPQYGSGVLRGPAPPPTGPAPVPQAIAPAPAVPPAAAPSGAAASVAMPPTTPGAAPVAGGPVTVKLPAAPTLPVPTIAPAQPLPAAPETPAVPARPVIPGGVAPTVSPQVAAQARRAQGVVLGLTMMGVHVPDFLQKEAGIAIAGRTAAAEAEARQPIELQTKMFEASLTAAQKRWDALTDQQKETLAAQRGATKDQMAAMYNNIHEQYKSILQLSTAGPVAQAQAEGALPSELAKLTGKTNEELRRDWDKPDKIEWTDADGVPHTRIATPRQLYAELNGAPPPGAPPMAGAAPVPSVVTPGAAVPGAAPPGAAVPGAAPPGSMRTGLSPAEKAQQEGRAKQALDFTNSVSTEAQQAISGRADIDVALAQAPNLNWQGIGAPYKQQFNRITQQVLGLNTEHVAAYETAQQMMGGMLRTALRASDPNPTERQQQMMMETFPTPSSSPQGYQQGLRHLQGIADWKVYRQEALNEWRQTHRSDEGFKESFKYSAIPFVVARMPENERLQYATQLYKKDPKAYDRLMTQMRETESKGYNYKY